MKKLFVLISLILVSVFCYSQTWTQLTTGFPNAILKSVNFIDANTGYVVGSISMSSNDGIIIKTTNGGTNWSSVYTCTGVWLKSVCMENSSVGYSVGELGKLLKTDNGGSVWIAAPLNPATSATIRSVYVYNTNRVYFACDGGYIYHKSGSMYDRISSSSYTQNLYSIYAINNGAYYPTVYAVGANGTILKTTNEGSNWVLQTCGTTNDIKSVYFTDVNTGYVAHDGRISKTTNGGTNWISTPYINFTFFNSIYFVDDNTGYAAGWSASATPPYDHHCEIYKTTNAGGTWTRDANVGNIIGDLNAIHFTNIGWIQTGYAVGETGIILKMQEGGVSINENKISEFNIYPNPVSSNGKITITSEDKINTFSIYNVKGERVLFETYNEKSVEIAANGLSIGIYMVKIQSENGVSFNKMVIK